jgi:23S rRNA (cytidine1920-2'-O)/16S rRNA (cytidine1409-2'-O)-methyltransferase
VQSSLPGPAGNLEYMLWLAASGVPLSEELLEAATTTVPAGREGDESP